VLAYLVEVVVRDHLAGELRQHEAIADEGLVPPLEVVRHLLILALVNVPVVLH